MHQTDRLPVTRFTPAGVGDDEDDDEEEEEDDDDYGDEEEDDDDEEDGRGPARRVGPDKDRVQQIGRDVRSLKINLSVRPLEGLWGPQRAMWVLTKYLVKIASGAFKPPGEMMRYDEI